MTKYHDRLRETPGNVESYIIFKRHLSKIVSITSGFSESLGVITKIIELMEHYKITFSDNTRRKYVNAMQELYDLNQRVSD